MNTSSTRWVCPKCERQIVTPLPATAVLCRHCTNLLRARETWMNPSDDRNNDDAAPL